jgi:hypothetical protein
MLAPLNFGSRARPSLVLEDRPVSFGEFAVEAGHMRDDDDGVGGERGDLIRIN